VRNTECIMRKMEELKDRGSKKLFSVEFQPASPLLYERMQCVQGHYPALVIYLNQLDLNCGLMF
jgi:hypothetical protein